MTFKINKHKKIPDYFPTFSEVSKQMRINAELIMKEISDHVDKELKRLKEGVKEEK